MGNRSNPGRPSAGFEPISRRALAGVLVLAAALRFWQIRQSLPDLLEEAIPMKVALGMKDLASGRIDWNPHFFNYPSLTIYLHLFLQEVVFRIGVWLGTYRTPADYLLAFHLDPTLAVLVARSLGVCADLACVWGVVRVADRLRPGSGWIAGVLAAVSPLAIATSRTIYADPVMAALSIWALERMLAWHERGDRRSLVEAALGIGLAAGAKYPAALLLAPLAAAAWHRNRARGAFDWLLAAAIALATFVVTTPFAVLAPAEFRAGFGFESAHAASGHFGSAGHVSLGFHLGHLLANLGPLGAGCLLASAVAIAGRRLGGPSVLVWLALVVFAVPISVARIDADRYLLPVLGAALALAGASAAGLLSQFAASRPMRLVVLSLLLVPVAWSGLRVAVIGSQNTQHFARVWLEHTVTPTDLVVQEAYGAPLVSESRVAETMASAEYQLASPAWQTRLQAVRRCNEVTLPLGVAGRVTQLVTAPDGRSHELEVFANDSDRNRTVYEPNLYRGVDYFVTSSAVRGRFEADPPRFPAPVRFYRWLDAHATIVAHWQSRGNVTGPEITVYRLPPGSRADSAVTRTDAWWWTEAIPDAYRIAATRELGGAIDSTTSSPREPNGTARPWVASLRPYFDSRIEPFAYAMALGLVRAGRMASAREYAETILAMDSAHEGAALVSAVASAKLQQWPEARRTLERALTADRAPSPALLLQYGRTLARLGEADDARRAYARVVRSTPASDPFAVAARTEEATLP